MCYTLCDGSLLLSPPFIGLHLCCNDIGTQARSMHAVAMMLAEGGGRESCCISNQTCSTRPTTSSVDGTICLTRLACTNLIIPNSGSLNRHLPPIPHTPNSTSPPSSLSPPSPLSSLTFFSSFSTSYANSASSLFTLPCTPTTLTNESSRSIRFLCVESLARS